MNYALIEDGKVKSVIYLHPMNASDFPNAVCADGYAVCVGDTYADGVFYRDGEEIKSDAQLKSEEMEDMKAALSLLGVNANE